MTSQATTAPENFLHAPVIANRDYRPLLYWLVIAVILALGLALLWRLGLIQQVLATDHTYMSSLIAIVFTLTSLHCLVQCIAISREQIAARQAEQMLDLHPGGQLSVRGGKVLVADGSALPPSIFTDYIADLVRKAQLQARGPVDQSILLRSLADRLNGRERLGQFVSEALLRMALLGTAIGFILMLLPISGITSFEAEILREALSGMSAGMAIALNVTVIGIASALILKLQYFALDQGVTELFDAIVRATEIKVLPVLERPGHALP